MEVKISILIQKNCVERFNIDYEIVLIPFIILSI